jgi:TRAP-type C4-dicarboxylate transport system substrate-binding protein
MLRRGAGNAIGGGDRYQMRGWMIALFAAFLLSAGSTRADETTLIFATDGPPDTHVSVRMFHPWSDHVNAVGKGVLKLDVRDGMTIVNPRNFYDRVLDDVVQISWGSIGPLSGTFVLSQFASLPFQADRAEDASVAFWRLYKSGLLDAEFKDVVPLMMTIYPQSEVHLAKPPKSIDTLSGLRLMVVAKTTGEFVTLLGGSPSSLALPDLYEGLRRGTVDGTIIAWTAFQPYRLGEVTSYHYETQFGASTGMVFMAKKRYDALPSAARKIIDDNSGEAETRALGKAWDEVAEEARQAAESDPKQMVVYPTPEEAAKWQQIAAPVTAAWIKNTPGSEPVLAKFREILAEVKAGR